MKIAIVICPFWYTNFPPLQIALLSAVVKTRGHSVNPFDLNKILYDNCKAEYKNMWKSYYRWYQDKDTCDDFLLRHKKIIDHNIKKICSSKPDAIIFYVNTSTKILTEKLAEKVKKLLPDSSIIFFGQEYCSAHRADKLFKESYIDFVVAGERYDILADLVDSIKSQSIVSGAVLFISKDKTVYTGTESANKPIDLNSLPYPDFDKLMGLYSNKFAILPIQASRGCINACVFCEEKILREKFSTMSADRIFEEILHHSAKYNIDFILFNDNLINGDMKTLIDFCRLMVENRVELLINKNKIAKINKIYDISWGGHAIVRPEMTKDVLNKMKKAGCSRLVYGIESGSNKVLKAMGKPYSVSMAEKVLKYTKEMGILVRVNIITGFPNESKEDFNSTIEFLDKNRSSIDDLVILPCMLIDGTSILKCHERFGITKRVHPLFWETDNGENTFAVRLARYNSLCEITKTHGYSIRKITSKSLMKRYHGYLAKTVN
jgi:radical SAM superfamily enzyme YgiQ (UPF0313 family)